MRDAYLLPAEERLLALFDRLRRLTLDQNPLGDGNVTGPQLSLLQWVATSPGCGIQDIANGLGLTSPTVSVSVRRLEEAGLLERRPDPADGRSIQVFVTGQGRVLQHQARTFRLNKMRRLLTKLAADEQEQLLALLKRAVDAAATPVERSE